jgi:hypothetical protein
MDHFFISAFGAVLLPLLTITMLGTLMGLKPEAILFPVFGLVGVFLKVLLDLAIVVVRTLAGGVMVIITRMLNVR